MQGQRWIAAMAAAGAALLAGAPGAGAQATLGECEGRELRGAECGTFPVPLDHADPRPPLEGRTLGLSFVRYRAAQAPRRGVVVVLAGGPGQAARALAAGMADGPLRSVRRRFDLVFVDQRGSGASSPLRCSTAPRGRFRVGDQATPAQLSRAVAACAAELGDDRRFYSTYATALDLDALRRFLEVPRIVPLGISYGGQVAGEYARRFPERTQALVLDSTSPIEGFDGLDRLTGLALPRVLREICFPPGCERVLGDPQALLRRAVARLSRGPLRGRVVLPTGRARSASIGVGGLYELVRASDTDPGLRTALPAALEAAGRGDAAPLLRLALQAEASTEPTESAVNEVRFLATVCTEAQLPWAPDSDPATRPALLEQALREGAGSFAPFPVSVAAPRVTAALCLGWPATPRPPFVPSPGAGPDLPVLVLGGREDLRTPLEDQRRAAAQFPRARVIPVPNVGHSTLTADPTACASGALTAFLYAQRRPSCRTARRPVPLALPAFASLTDVPGFAGRAPARVGRTAVAVDVTLRDAFRQIDALAFGGTTSGDLTETRLRVGGLRGGRLELTRRLLVLRDYEVVPGVRVSGRLGLQGAGTLTVGGRGARGTLVLRRTGTFTGTLDGFRLVYRPRAR